MVSLLDKKLFRDILREKGLILAIVFIIAFGAASLVGMLGTYLNLEVAKENYYVSST